MNRRQLLTLAILTIGFYGLLGTEVQCTPAQARPSLDDLQAQIDDLRTEVLHVFDRNGDDMGVFAGFLQPGSSTRAAFVHLPDHQLTYLLDMGSGTVPDFWPISGTTYRWESPDCSGEILVEEAGELLHPSPGDGYLAVETSFSLRSTLSFSNRPYPNAGECDPSLDQLYLVVARPIDPALDLGLNFPLAAPLFVGSLPND